MKRLNVWSRYSLIAGVAGGVVCAAAAYVRPDRFCQGYLFGYLFWLGIGLGALALLMLYHLTGGRWGESVAPALEAATRPLPLLVPLVLPVLWGMDRLYIWSDGGSRLTEPLGAGKQAYLSDTFFTVRLAIYFAIWLGLAWAMRHWSTRRDEANRPRLHAVSAAGSILYLLTMTLAYVDLVMSMQPHWYSTIFGMLVAVGEILAGAAFVLVARHLLQPDAPWPAEVTHDLGNILLLLVLGWTYLAFSQYLIIWYANLPDDVVWYTRRLDDGFGWMAPVVATLHFALPAALLLSARVKRQHGAIASAAAVLLLGHLLYVFWLVAPAGTGGLPPFPGWIDLAAAVAVGGLWLNLFIRGLQVGDPAAREAAHG